MANKSDESIDCDVLIIGAGPAGAAAAKPLVENGYRVVIIEKKKLPRYKMCSGLIADRSQEFVEQYFGSPPDNVFCEPRTLKGFRFCLAEDSMIDAPFGERPTLNVWRSEFDYWLVKQSGAEILDEHELIGFEQTPHGVSADVSRHKEQLLKINAEYMIGADGATSRVRKLLDPVFEEQTNWMIPTQLYCKGTVNLDPGYFYGFLDPAFGPFYAWLNFKDEYLVYGVAPEKGGHVAPYLDKFTDYLERFFQLNIQEVIRKVGCLGVDLGTREGFILGDGCVLLIGEAGGFMNMFGEGISSALATGIIAADAIQQAKSSEENVISIYDKLTESERQMVTASWNLVRTIAGKDFKFGQT